MESGARGLRQRKDGRVRGGAGEQLDHGLLRPPDIPYYWDYASQYVLDDNFYSSLMGPTFPNHLYIASGTSGTVNMNYSWVLHGGIADDPEASFSLNTLSLDWGTLAQEMTGANVSWAWYNGQATPTEPSFETSCLSSPTSRTTQASSTSI